jgi:hypothetical protein
MSGKRYYGYQGYSGHRRGVDPSDGLFGWTVFLFLLIGFVFLCWMGSYYIFANPEKPSNYHLLKRLHKIEAPQRFEISASPPRGEFLKPGQLLERFGSMTSSEMRRTNQQLLRCFVRNYHQNRDLVPYAVGTYRVIGTLPLSNDTFCQHGLVALLQAVEQPEVLLEQLFTTDEKNLPGLKHALTPNQEIKLEKPLDLSAIIQATRLDDNRILLTTMPLLYGTYGAGHGPASFSLQPPDELNLDAGVPVLTPAQISDLSGGKLAHVGSTSKGSSPHLSRIAEEMATPEPEVARAIPVTHSTPVQTSTAPQTNVARALPVNEPAVMAAIPVNTPVPVAQAVASDGSAIPRAIPAGIPLPAAVAPMPLSTPVPTATPTPPPKPILSPSPVTTPTPAPTTAAGVAAGATNQPVTAPTQVWPVYEPGKMPRGRLVESSDADDLVSHGIGGERHYLKGRFTVTASGNGRAVLRPQGALAGVPMGPSSKVRVIVDFPAGSVPPSEGSSFTRDSLRPFQVSSVKRGDDGQINIYVREITLGH